VVPAFMPCSLLSSWNCTDDLSIKQENFMTLVNKNPLRPNMFNEILSSQSSGSKPHGCSLSLHEDYASTPFMDGKVLWVPAHGGKPSRLEPQICSIGFACPVGQYTIVNTTSGRSVCTDCPAGLYTKWAGNWSSCLPCPEGRYCPGGSSYVTVAEPGFEDASGSACIDHQESYTTIHTVADCKKAALSGDSFPEHPAASWRGLIDWKDDACTTFRNDTKCPFQMDSTALSNWRQPAGCFLYLRQDTKKSFYMFNTVLFGQGYDGEPEELQPQICMTSKRACPSGKYQPLTAASSCIECDSGRYADHSAARRCTGCPAGKYQQGTGASTCTECPPGEFQQVENSTSCSTCACVGADQFCHSRDGCKECTAGGKPDEGRFKCVGGCPKGQYLASDGCHFCHEGHFCASGIYDTSPLNEVCEASGQAPINFKDECEAAVNNQVFFSHPNARFQGEGDNSELLDLIVDPGPDVIGCTINHQSDTIYWIDRRGTLNAPASTSMLRVCADYREHKCPAGKYQQKENATQCEECPQGQYTDAAGARECSFCVQGRYSLDSSLATTAVGPTSCDACATYFDESTTAGVVNEQCAACNPGQYRLDGECAHCPSGKFQRGVGQESCVDCAAGQYQSKDGQSYCDIAKKGTVLIAGSNQAGVATALDCPSFGVHCSDGIVHYQGGVWHDPMVRSPNCTTVNGAEVCTHLYLCVTDGCPDAGATHMKCKDGYQGPLCAACASGYFKSGCKCTPCARVRTTELIAFVLSMISVIALLLFLSRKYHRYLDHKSIFSRECYTIHI
jgi:hypothetical protein